MSLKFVKDSIAKQRVVIFSKSYCPYCSLAKEQFKKLNFEFLAIEIEDMQNCQEIQNVLCEMTGSRSVPRVFVDQKFIGGGTDVKKLYETGELAKLLGV